MERRDQNMPFLLRYENVAWYEAGKVRILDRRVYPTEVRFVECESYQEVARAIADMVTQSAGPYTAVGMGMALPPTATVRSPTGPRIWRRPRWKRGRIPSTPLWPRRSNL